MLSSSIHPQTLQQIRLINQSLLFLCKLRLLFPTDPFGVSRCLLTGDIPDALLCPVLLFGPVPL